MLAHTLLVGCGKMGRALLNGWLKTNPDLHITVVEPGTPTGLPAHIAVFGSAADLPSALKPDLVVFAIKPQQLDGVLASYRRFAGATFLSIAAGKTLAKLAAGLGANAAIIRAMPNTPAAIGQGISVAMANAHVSEAGHALAEAALSAGGQVAWVAEEAQLDAVTAVSGSGPAYVFLLVEAMAAAGVSSGLPPALAMQLARQTVIGSGALLGAEAASAADLRAAVTSPGGTTAAALAVLQPALHDLMTEAVRAATARARELA